MHTRKLVGVAAVSLLSVSHSLAHAQSVGVSELGTISVGTALSFQSEILAEERKVLISLPDDYLSSSERYPVVYLLDPLLFHQFQYSSGVIRTLADIEMTPKLILVGVHSENRDSDMTAASPTNGGNADNFIRFFREELQGFIAQQYRTEPYTILIGHSAGGLFALHTLVHAPDTFDAYIAISPSAYWDEGAVVDDLRAALDSGRRFNNALFTSIASETDRTREYYERFVEMITADMPDGLEFSSTSFPDEVHASTPITGIYHGLRSIYKDWPPPDSIDSLDSLLTRYRSLSERYGYSVKIPASHASAVGFRLISSGDPTGALDVFEYSLANISQNEIAHYQVGFALRRLGRLAEAQTAFEKAIELGGESPMLDVFIRFRDEVAQELNGRDVQ